MSKNSTVSDIEIGFAFDVILLLSVAADVADVTT